jgi:hypothetical protein
MQLQDFGLTFGNELTEVRLDRPTSSVYVLFANGIPWYSVKELSFGTKLFMSSRMNFDFTHGGRSSQFPITVSQCIIDHQSVSIEKRMALIRNTLKMRMHHPENSELIAAIDYWLGRQTGSLNDSH